MLAIDVSWAFVQRDYKCHAIMWVTLSMLSISRTSTNLRNNSEVTTAIPLHFNQHDPVVYKDFLYPESPNFHLCGLFLSQQRLFCSTAFFRLWRTRCTPIRGLTWLSVLSNKSCSVVDFVISTTIRGNSSPVAFSPARTAVGRDWEQSTLSKHLSCAPETAASLVMLWRVWDKSLKSVYVSGS